MWGIRPIAWAVCALAASAIFAQNASVSGTVTDPSGAAVIAASVTVLNVNTGVAAPTVTNGAGVFVFPSLQPGTYTIRAEHAGFRRAVVDQVILEIGSQLTVNLGLELGQATETVEVSARATPINATSATIGDVVTGKQLQDLPLRGRNAYDLLTTQPGVIGGTGAGNNFYVNGNQGNAVNYTTDGINSQNNLLTGTFYLYSNVMSVDRAEEVRVVTSPADAEYGRGAGQVQIITRGGTNTFHGSAFEEHRNTDFNANDFFNNARGTDPVTHQPVSPRNILIRNSYGIRFGGPVKRNKTFFNGIYEPYKERQRNAFTALVYTPTARQGIFRFFPGVLNANAGAATPTVDFSGNPLQPAAATGPLQSVSVFGRDPNRLAADPTGAVTKALNMMPPPNNFRTMGDGLNTAGFTWNRPVPVNFELYEGRIDHVFNDKHRIALVLNQQSFHSINVASPPPYPASPWQVNPTETTQYSVTLTSVLRPTLINEVKIGVFRPRTLVLTPFDPNDVGPVSHQDVLSKSSSGVPYLLCFTGSTLANGSCVSSLTGGLTNPVSGNQSNYIAPVYQWGDSLSWIHGRHSFKGGLEVRLISDSGYDANNVTPSVRLGNNASLPVSGVTSVPMIGNNATPAQNLLLDLSGTVLDANQTNNSPGGKNPQFLPGETRYREWHQNELSWYFKDDFKLRPNLTLNLGIRYELYFAPREAQGKMLAPVGGASSVFGISGTTFANGIFQPGVLAGTMTTIQNIGAGTAHPDGRLYNTDYNNFAPAVGFAWSLGDNRLKWLTGGKDSTTIRAGYSIGYQRLPIYLTHYNSGFEPGFSEVDQSVTSTSLANLTLPVPSIGAPLSTVPFTGLGSHSQNLLAYDPNLRTPYVQNYSFSIQRSLGGDTSFTVSYVGSKGTKLARSIDTNEVNIYNNGLLDAFRTVQAGGTSPLIEQIFGGFPAVTAAGSAANYVRTNSATQTFFANNNPGGFANYINTTNALTGVIGGLLGHAGLPANFIVANPQFLSTYLTGNWGNSTYNSLQIQGTRRFSGGFSLQGSFVWSKALGEDDGQSSTLQADYRTLRNAHQDKTLLSFHHAGVFKLNSIYELPFGRGKSLGRNAGSALDHVIGGWQVGAIYNYYSGAPLTITGQNTINTFALSAGYTPALVGSMPQAGVSRTPGYVTYFSGLTQIQTDPARGAMTPGLAALSTLRSINDASGAPVLINAAPGQLGSLPLGQIIGPGATQLDMNLKKHIRLTERFNLEIGATATNATNTVRWGNPTAANLSINSVSFGRLTALATGAGPRILVLQGRLNF